MMDRSTRPPGSRLAATLVPALPLVWLGLFFLVPFGIVLKISLSHPATAQPPYRPVLDWSEGWAGLQRVLGQLDLENFRTLLSDDLYLSAALSSLAIAAASTALLLVLGYPVAYAMARAPQRWRPILLGLVILPFWTSFLIRVYAWIAILKPEGWLNQALIGLGIIQAPLQILNTNAAVLIGIVYAYFPFMVLPLYASLERQDESLVEAAQDLGCSPLGAFWRVTMPLSLPGVLAGSLLCFIPIMGEFVIPELLGGSETLMLGRTLWSEFFSNRDWPLASALAVALLAVLLLPILVYREVETRRWQARR